MNWMRTVLCAAALVGTAHADINVLSLQGCPDAGKLGTSAADICVPVNDGFWFLELPNGGGRAGTYNIISESDELVVMRWAGFTFDLFVQVTEPSTLILTLDDHDPNANPISMLDVYNESYVLQFQLYDAPQHIVELDAGFYLFRIIGPPSYASGQDYYYELTVTTDPPGPCSLEADIDGNGSVDITDLAILLANFGCN